MNALTLAQHDDTPVEDQIVVLRGATWADFERLLEIRGDTGGPRIAYLDGSVEVMSPSKSHELLKSKIGRLVEVWCLERDLTFEVVGSWTLKDQPKESGLEPDECYVFGDQPDAERPDLAIEVIWTSGGLSKLEIYKRLGVREVWHWRRGALEVHVLRDGEYEARERSEVLPGIDLKELVSHLEQPASAAIRAYREVLQKNRH